MHLLFVPFITVIVFYYAGVYKSVIRYIDFSLVYLIFKAILISIFLVIFLKYSFVFISSLFNLFSSFQSSLIGVYGWLVGISSAVLLILGSRLVANNLLSERSSEKRVIIYGAGAAGIQLASALRVSSEMEPVAFVDNDKSLHGTFLGGLKILDPRKIEKLSQKKKIDEVLIAMPSASKTVLRGLLKEIEEHSIKVRILPGLSELAQGKITVSDLKEVDISDLLGRIEVEPIEELINKNIKNKVVLITGAGGSIGSEITRQVSRNSPKELILLDSSEYALYQIVNELEKSNLGLKIHSVLANVTNPLRIESIFSTFQVDTVYHTAAYKHVPIVEENPFEAVNNNIIGTLNCVKHAIQHKVETFVLISTDKAVRPTNIMGATKRFSEMILQAESNEKVSTKMIMVRFGNVVGSSGSAIPLFQQQIQEGGPVTVTHPEITRFFMSIPEAAELVLQAGAMGEGGDVFVLDMGEPIKILDLAKRLIRLCGMEVKDDENPLGDIEIQFSGLRPGEKLYEELLIGNNVTKTEHTQIYRAEENFLSKQRLNHYLKLILQAESANDRESLKQIFIEIIDGYKPEELKDNNK